MPEKTISIKVIPKSHCARIEGEVTDDAGKSWLVVRLTAAPEDGKANKALLKLLAKEWGIPASSLSIVSGEASRYKAVRVERA